MVQEELTEPISILSNKINIARTTPEKESKKEKRPHVKRSKKGKKGKKERMNESVINH